MKLLKNVFATAVLCVAMTTLSLLAASPANANGYQQRHDRMSSMGKRAKAAVARINAQAHVKAPTGVHALASVRSVEDALGIKIPKMATPRPSLVDRPKSPSP